jgi:hypothetical protein
LTAPANSLPPLPPIDESLYVLHFSTGLQEDFPNEPTPFNAVVAQQYATGDQDEFSAFDLFARRVVDSNDFRAAYPELERMLLGNFARFVSNHPNATWLHWRFPFSALARRSCWVGAGEIDIPGRRCFDLANYLKLRFGDGYASGDPRLWHAIRLNLGGKAGMVPGVLADEETKAAWHGGALALLHTNTATRVGSIACLFVSVRRSTGLAMAWPSPYAVIDSRRSSSPPSVTVCGKNRPVAQDDRMRDHGFQPTDGGPVAPHTDGGEAPIRRMRANQLRVVTGTASYLPVRTAGQSPQIFIKGVAILS